MPSKENDEKSYLVISDEDGEEVIISDIDKEDAYSLETELNDENRLFSSREKVHEYVEDWLQRNKK